MCLNATLYLIGSMQGWESHLHRSSNFDAGSKFGHGFYLELKLYDLLCPR